MLGYAFPDIGCPWGGAYFPPGIWMNGRMDRHVVAHELGHTYGIIEEGPGWACVGSRCEAHNYANPYSVMGHGLSDFNAFEKLTFGWIDRVAQAGRNGEVTIGAIDRPAPTRTSSTCSPPPTVLVRVPPAPARLEPRRADGDAWDSRRRGDERSLLATLTLPQRDLLLSTRRHRTAVRVRRRDILGPGRVRRHRPVDRAHARDRAPRWTDRTRPSPPRSGPPAGRQ